MLVTIGIPFYNSERTLADAIRSVFAQTLTDWELLLVDDGSQDASVNIAQSVDDPRVRVIPGRENRGISSRLNQLSALAQAKCYARMDADDLMHPRRLACQVAFLEAHPRVDVVSSAAYIVDADCGITGMRGCGAFDTGPATVLRHGLLMHPTVMGRTEWFRANPYDEDYFYAEDYELWCRVLQTTRFDRIPEPLLFYRDFASSSLRKHMRQCRLRERAMRTHGPAIAGRLQTAACVAESAARSVAYHILCRAGMQEQLVRRRSLPVPPDKLNAARAVLRTVLSTPVPGLA